MSEFSRRQFIKVGSSMLAASPYRSASLDQAQASPVTPDGSSTNLYQWIRSSCTLIAEGYNPPFYPHFEYEADKALTIAKQLSAEAMRYPAMAYFVHFPTQTRLPIHPKLPAEDPLRRTVERFSQAGLKVVAYHPVNHPFMDVESSNPRYQDWVKRFPDGTPMTTGHYGFGQYYEGCINSPISQEYLNLYREVITNYPVDVMYFDGPHQGMAYRHRFCHCGYCQEKYMKARGKKVPLQDRTTTLEDEIEYRNWMVDDVLIPFMRSVKEMIRQVRDVPAIFNDNELLEWRMWAKRVFPVLDGFMFEAAETPEEKLFNLKLGQSTGKVVWTYVGNHTLYNMEHVKSLGTGPWYSYPLESQELLMDGVTAIVAGTGMVYWGLSRFFYQPNAPDAYESGRHVREIFTFVRKYRPLLASVKTIPPVGILVGSQTIDWYQGKEFDRNTYSNCYLGAFQLLKENSYDAEPFLDHQMTAESLAPYKLVYVPNAVCLSRLQCAALTKYVEDGGTLIATHLTSVADEYGRPRQDFGLAQLFGARLKSLEPVELPELYLRDVSSGELIPQDPQVVLLEAEEGTTLLAETYDRGRNRVLGPALLARRQGKGQVFYMGSNLEAIYEETRIASLRAFFSTLFKPILDKWRTYEVDFHPGLMPQLMVSANSLLLHLLANTGNKRKKLRLREQYLPIHDIKARIRIPQGRLVKSVSLLRSGNSINWALRDNWMEMVVPRVLIHEVVSVELN